MNATVINALLAPLLPKLRGVVDAADVATLATDVGAHLSELIGPDAFRRAKMAELLREVAEVLDRDPADAG